MNANALLVTLAVGLEDGGRRAALAFGLALAALADGKSVTVFLSLESAVLGTPKGALGVHPRGFSDDLETYIGHFLELGGQLEVCSSCYEEYCRELEQDEFGRAKLREGTTVRSLGVVAERAFEMPVISF